VHVGCFEVFGSEGIHSILDLKGKSVGVEALGSPPHLFLSVIAGNIGIDPGKDINWVTSGSVRPMQVFIDGKIDAFLGLPPSRKSFVPGISAASSSTARATAPIRTTSAAC
jgi:NitT/TauT family transport system substrate-binding protein